MFLVPFVYEIYKASDDTHENVKTDIVCHCRLCNYDTALIVIHPNSKCYLYVLHISLLSVRR